MARENFPTWLWQAVSPFFPSAFFINWIMRPVTVVDVFSAIPSFGVFDLLGERYGFRTVASCAYSKMQIGGIMRNIYGIALCRCRQRKERSSKNKESLHFGHSVNTLFDSGTLAIKGARLNLFAAETTTIAGSKHCAGRRSRT
jgi:hypothetical protein